MSTSRWSVHDPIEGMSIALEELGRAIDSTLMGDRDVAIGWLRSADRDDIRQHYAIVTGRKNNVGPRSMARVPKQLRPPRIVPAKRENRELFARDGWRCRFCRTRVVDSEVVTRLRKLFPEQTRWGKGNAGQHIALLAMRATHDHVVPDCYSTQQSTGENLVTACGLCQFGRGDWLLADVGIPGVRPPEHCDGWDGLRRLLGQRTK